MATETEERFEKVLKDFDSKLNKCTLNYEDGCNLLIKAENLYIHFGQIRKSREKWKDECLWLRKELKMKCQKLNEVYPSQKTK